MAGIDVEYDLEDPELMAVVSEVIQNFDPDAAMTEGDAMFGVQQM